MSSSTTSVTHLSGVGTRWNTNDTVSYTWPSDITVTKTSNLFSSYSNHYTKKGWTAPTVGGLHFYVHREYLKSGAIQVSDSDTLDWNGDLTVFKYSYNGGVCMMDPSNMTGASTRNFSDSEIKAWGTAGFARAIPTKPKSQALQFLVELRDLPKLPQLGRMAEAASDFRKLAKYGSEEYLNAEFGWKPFISDVRKQTQATYNAKKHVSQFVRDSGRRVKRSRTLLEETTTTQGTYPTLQGLWPVNSGLQQGNNATYIPYVDSVESKVWFSGSFTYYIADEGKEWYSPSSLKRGEQILNHLYGTRVTPALLWELAPWSWMADYFGNVGDIINNFSAFGNDNLVCHYGFLMLHSKSVRTYTRNSATIKNGRTLYFPPAEYIVEDKKRYKADPYGFALNTSLTDAQAAILAALGLSRAF